MKNFNAENTQYILQNTGYAKLKEIDYADFEQLVKDHSKNAKEIIRHIENLGDEYKVPFTRYYNGYKYEEIANEMKLPLGTVKSRIFIARKILMDGLKHFRN